MASAASSLASFAGTFMGWLQWLVPITLASFAIGAFGLALAAARLGQRQAWLAWVPVANLFTVCRVSGLHPAWMVAMLLPLVNLVAFGVAGAGMAARLGQPRALGALYGFPLLGNTIPLLLAAAGRTAGQVPGSPWRTALLHSGAALGVVVAAWGGMRALQHLTTVAPPSAEEVAARLPDRMAGSLRVFPIDSAPDDPALPANVVSLSLEQGQDTAAIPDGQLPPWIDPASLPAVADGVVTADYQPASGGAEAKVMSLSLRPGEGPALALPSSEQLPAGAEVLGTEVTSPDGEVYRGYRVSSGDAVYFALEDLARTRALLVSGRGRDGAALAERLAGNVGNGEGLLDVGDYRAAFAELPQAPPGAVLMRTQTVTSSEIQSMLAQAEAANPEEVAEAGIGGMLATLRAVAPSVGTVAAYRAGEGNYVAALGTYDSSTSAWSAQTALGGLVRMLPDAGISTRTVAVGETDALWLEGGQLMATDASGAGVLLRRGNTLVFLAGVNVPPAELMGWLEAYAGRP